MPRETKNILFVCFGNICRSPFAEGLFTKLAAQTEQKNLLADSAGLFALPGNSVTSLAQRVAVEHDVDLSGHKAKLVSKALVKWSDLILVMEKSHIKTLLETFPEAADKPGSSGTFPGSVQNSEVLPTRTDCNMKHTGFAFLTLRMRFRGSSGTCLTTAIMPEIIRILIH